MRHVRYGKLLLAVWLAASPFAFAQGGRAGRAAAAAAQQTPAAPPAAGRGGTIEFYSYDSNAGGAPPIADAPPVETHQKITVNGDALAYTARAGFLPLRNATTGQAEAHIFYTAYLKDGVSDASGRPLMFFFGGAPGVASTWQEFGGLGPKRMKWAKDGTAGAPPYGWGDNPHTILPQTDLVFVNPVGTAFSRPDQPGKAPAFWTSSADTASMAEFVRSFLTGAGRRNSPLYLAAEDQGTARASALAAYFAEHQIPVQGVVLLSMTMSADATAGDTQYLTLFPSLVMASWFHKKLAPELNSMSAEQISGQARQFASRAYLHALYKGDRMSAEERTKAIAEIARLTGLSKQFIASNDLRITLDRFNAEVMRGQHKEPAASDARVAGFTPPIIPAGRGGGGGGRGLIGAAAPAPIDLNLHQLAGGLQIAYETYLRKEMTFTGGNGIYYLNTGGIGPFTATVTDDGSLSGAFARNPNLRLFVAVNYFDLSAPFYATEYTLAHLNVSPEARAHNITISHYDAGRMPYVDDKALAKLQGDLARFVDGSKSGGSK